jgi:hypothetical protein
MKKQARKLVLSKETVRNLGAEMLGGVGGGQGQSGALCSTNCTTTGGTASYGCTDTFASNCYPPETMTPSLCNC